MTGEKKPELTSEIPIRDYPVDKLDAFSTIEKCNGNEKRAKKQKEYCSFLRTKFDCFAKNKSHVFYEHEDSN